MRKILKNIFENIDIVYQLYSFRCIINLSYEVTPLLIYCKQIYYTSKVPYAASFFQKSCKVVFLFTINENGVFFSIRHFFTIKKADTDAYQLTEFYYLL